MVLTFSNPQAQAGAFYCDNGSETFAVDYPELGTDATPLIGLPCTQGTIPQNSNVFYSESDSGSTVTLTFTATAASVLNWTFYTTPGNLVNFQETSPAP